MNMQRLLLSIALLAPLSACSSTPPIEQTPQQPRPTQARSALPLAISYDNLFQDWSVTQHITPSGNTSHPTNYFDEPPFVEPNPAFATDTQQALTIALAGSEAQNWSGDNATDAATQPFHFLYDVLALPVRVCIDRPWELQTSPTRDIY